MTKITYIPGEIANAAIDEHGNRKPVTRTQHIFDDTKGKSQADINKEFGNAIGGLNSQNYVTVDSFDALPATGAVDTVYRVSNWDGTQQDPTVYSEYAWNGSQYVHLSTKTQIGEVFDISAYHATGGTLATYADLSAALDSNNGGGVPQSLQKGGMSVKFVQSSDNKYVQYRLMADSWSVNTADWSICGDDVLVENPEFVYVKTDKDDKILWAIKIDGGIYYGAGVPQQVIDYIEEKIEELSLDEYENIVAFLNDLEKGDKTLQELLNEKVDKVEGKSLSTNDYTDDEKEITNSFSLVENPEYLNVETDAEDRILGGRKTDGTKFENMPTETPSVVINSENNPEYNEVHTDKDGRILYGVKPNGEFFWAKGIMASDKEKQYIIDAISNYPSVKYLPLMQSLKRTVIKTEEGTGKGQPDISYKTLSLATLTDIHAGTANLLRFIEFIDKYRDYIDDSIILGDIAGSDWPHYATIWDDIAGYQRILKVIGNHDIYHYNDGTEDATEAQCYGRYMQGISQWGVNYTADKCYYYKDYVDANIRLIVLDCEHITTEQTEWLQNVLNGDGNAESALALGRHVVIAQHRPVGDKSKMTLVECNFTTKNLDPKVQTTAYAAVNEAVKDFQDAGGTFVMYMAGHWHWDIIANYDGYYPNQTLVVYPNGKFDGYWRDTVHTENTSFFDQFTITSIDTKMKYIRLLRIGATFDRHLIHRESIVLSYADNDRKIISQY